MQEWKRILYLLVYRTFGISSLKDLLLNKNSYSIHKVDIESQRKMTGIPSKHFKISNFYVIHKSYGYFGRITINFMIKKL